MKEEDFKNPSKEFRGAPFWSLNDRLEDDELKRQIALMDEAWFGGFFLHAREGLTTSYMGEEWMGRLKACVEAAEARGMYAWLYDEDKWPSGFAGGIVTAQKPEYRAKVLSMMVSGRLDEVREAVRVFECDFIDGKPVNLKPPSGEGMAGKNYLYFCLCEGGIGSKWYDGFTYLDTLSHEAVKAFIESTYEPYYKRFGKWFGSVIPGIFTDEPNYYAPRAVDYPSIPWTTGFPDYFIARKGYDLREHLPSLFFNVGDYMKVRFDYWSAVTSLFVEAYSKQLYEWCDAHGFKYTGHYLMEETLVSQTRVAGAAMPHYEYMHLPGIDHLSRNIHGFLTVKQVASAANQLAKERVLSESYGCSGQNMSFEDRKWIGDWEYVLGVNLLNHHLSLYTMRGRRKRDYPPTIFYQQPWWKYNALIDAYFARLSYALSRGFRVADILVIHPIGSAWTVYSPINPREAERLHRDFETVCRLLLETHRDYELGDEAIMAGHGKVEGVKIGIGRGVYSAIIIPPSVNIAETTLKLLSEYAENGGLLIAVKPTPNLVEGKTSGKLQNLLTKALTINLSEEELAAALKPVKAKVEVSDPVGKPVRNVWYHLRRDAHQQILFLANTNMDGGFDLTVKVRGKGAFEEWNPFNGDVKPIPYEAEEGYTTYSFNLPPAGSKLLVLDELKEPVESGKAEAATWKEITLPRKWRVQRMDLNAITLDHCRFKVEDGDWSTVVPVWKAHRQVSRSGLGAKFTIEYRFEAELKPGENKEVWLVIESPERYVVRVNGVPISYREDYGWWVDTSFKKIPVGSLVKGGLNTVAVDGRVGFYKEMIAGTDAHDLETELESIYIVGDFAVENRENRRFKIVDESLVAQSGDFVRGGYPFYAGILSLTQELNLPRIYGKAVMVIEGLKAIVANVIVNGFEAGQIFLRPHEVDVTSFLKEGVNMLEVQLVGSLRNLLGPHHHKAGELLSVGPGSFVDEVNWVDDYNFVPFGLEDVKILFEEGNKPKRGLSQP